MENGFSRQPPARYNSSQVAVVQHQEHLEKGYSTRSNSGTGRIISGIVFWKRNRLNFANFVAPQGEDYKMDPGYVKEN